MGTLKNKVALVTGASYGIGRAVALKLASEGASVVVNGLEVEACKDTVATIEAQGLGQAIAHVGDVTDPDFSEAFVQTAINTYGDLDIIVNNAGYVWDNVIQKMTDDQWDAILDVHLKAPFRILRAAQPVISSSVKRIKQSGGQVPCRKIVNISSIAGLGGNPGQSNYASAKAGILGLTKTLAKEWGRYNVTVNCVAFGLIETRTVVPYDGGETLNIQGRDIRIGLNPELLTSMQRMIPLERYGSPLEAAGAIYLLCIPESDYVTGQTLVCSGGLTI